MLPPRPLPTRPFQALCLSACFGCCSAGPAAATPADLAELSLEDLLRIEVTSASKYPQPATLAPSSITVIGREEIRNFGWRTLAEAINAQRGFHVNDDRTYHYVGVRGFAPPGDLDNRILFLIDGMRVNDNVYDSVMAGETFPLDLALVERIEVVRGPGAAMYGGNALFGTINVVTRSGAALAGGEGSVQAGQHGRIGARASAGRSAGGVDWLLSFSGAHSEGGRFEFVDVAPGTRSPAGADAERWQRAFGKFSTGEWRGQVIHGLRSKQVPTAGYGTLPNDDGHREDDRFTLAELEHTLARDDRSSLATRVFAGHYRYDSALPYDYSGETPPRAARLLNRDRMEGQWQGLETRWQSTAWTGQRWVAGFEAVVDRHMTLANVDDDGTVYFRAHPTSRRWGLYAQDEITLGAADTLTLGLRHDKTQERDGRWSPRLAWVHQVAPQHTFKLLHGTAFRHANASERIGAFANPGLRPETLRSSEVVWESTWGGATHLTGSLYRYLIRDAIGWDSTSNRMENGAPVSARGAELELSHRFAGGTWLRSSYTALVVRQDGRVPDNSPAGLLKLHASVPLTNAWRSGIEVLAIGKRQTAGGSATVAGSALVHASLGYRPVDADWELALKVDNLFDRRSSDPAPADPWFVQVYGFQRAAIARDGRLLSLQWTGRWR